MLIHYSPPLYQLSYGEISMGCALPPDTQPLRRGSNPTKISASSGSRTRAQTLATFDHNR